VKRNGKRKAKKRGIIKRENLSNRKRKLTKNKVKKRKKKTKITILQITTK
jgi:hypothetical protein